MNKKKNNRHTNINIKNRRASFDYEFIDIYTAGIVLTGTEIKSIRMGKASLVDSYCYFTGGEMLVKNMNICEEHLLKCRTFLLKLSVNNQTVLKCFGVYPKPYFVYNGT